ncbi:transglutaminase domain-containing protein [Tenacibaculum sp. M341]|uniref:transglutaminase domain-containing protein n=1 Tax=Tenacibaculum sp. M341 TaxID=2530339 RepID=UPI001047DBB5|nr:transglutaminase domain-containing protein [Tenacibaculum sp. M341]TCI84737.1 hypothetical protein EYW44_20060 [Tenacibaculum sp. M341]
MIKKVAFLLWLFVSIALHAQIEDFKHVDFTKADNIASLNKGQKLTNLPLLAHKLTSKLTTDIEKFRAIYKWVCNNIHYDFNAFNTINKKRRKLSEKEFLIWNKSYRKTVYKRLLKRKKTMCTGYAYLIKEFCFIVGIESEIIDGYGRSVVANVNSLELANHSWNAIKLNDKWYLCDATWSSGYMDGDKFFVKSYNDGYFLTDPVFFNKTHYPLNKEWLLSGKQTDISFVNGPLLYPESFKYRVFPVFPSSLYTEIKKKEIVNFEYKTLNVTEKQKYSLIYFKNDTLYKIPIKNIENNNGKLKFQATFNRKGTHDIHLQVNNDIVASYTLQVN